MTADTENSGVSQVVRNSFQYFCFFFFIWRKDSLALERAKPTMSKPKRVTLKQIAETNSQVIFYKLEKRVHKLLKMISGITFISLY